MKNSIFITGFNFAFIYIFGQIERSVERLITKIFSNVIVFFLVSSISSCFSEEIISMLLSISTLKSSFFIPGAASLTSSLFSFSFKFSEGKLVPIPEKFLSVQTNTSFVKRSLKILFNDGEKPFF